MMSKMLCGVITALENAKTQNVEGKVQHYITKPLRVLSLSNIKQKESI